MKTSRKKISIYNLIFIFFIFLVLISYFFISKSQKEKELALKPISINLLTSVHPKLSWSFQPTKPKIFVKPGEVVTIEYEVENLSDEASIGIATFAYFPNYLGSYISKINCFCYDAQTLKAKQKDKFVLVLLIDPEVTKDSKTKDIKEVTIQFTFFDYKSYKKQEN